MALLAPPPDERPPKCFLTQGTLPKYCDLDQAPTKRKPFSTILSKPFLHRVDLILPAAFYDAEWAKIEGLLEPARFSRVKLRLSDILTGDFFNTYVKKGNVALLSEGRPGVDPLYSLHEGKLRLELPRPLYETAGLIGEAVDDLGRKHVKKRFAIEYDLRHVSMVRGRKGFDRLVWASQNALNSPLTWLFLDLSAKSDASEAPITAFHPRHVDIEPTLRRTKLKVPDLTAKDNGQNEIEQEDALAVLEWLDLVKLDSPRIRTDDRIDPYLSRYSAPEGQSVDDQGIVHLSWSGFTSSRWAHRLSLLTLNACLRSSEYWVSLSGCSLKKEGTDDQLGWSLLRGPMQGRIDNDTHMQDATTNEGAEKKTERPAPRFLLYEMSSA